MTNPASSGPAGSVFEGQVGAYYLLSLLTGSEPRGLPGTNIERVEFQRADDGHPLDDVIVHARDRQGNDVVLEIQVKRSCTFAPKDSVFRDVVFQIAEAAKKPDFWNDNHELAIAIAKTSGQIETDYQTVLVWARQLGSAKVFFEKINRARSANDKMRSFVNTFKTHLKEAEIAIDDEMVWKLLNRFQILVYDFANEGSASQELTKERAIHALHSDESHRATDLLSSLFTLAINIAASGGDRNREGLIENLKTQSFRLAGSRRFANARATLVESAGHALDDINDRVGGVILTRHERIDEVNTALNKGRYIEIRGNAGVGKSGVLKHFANKLAVESPIIVLSPNRVPLRGAATMKAELGFDGTIKDLLIDIACDGGGTLFIDNLDFFNEDAQTTVKDLLREVAKIPGFTVITTARHDFGIREPSWLPTDALSALGQAQVIILNEINDNEIDQLKSSAPKLALLLGDKHPAREVSRNLFRLSRLADQTSDDPIPRTEVDMAEQWWKNADGKQDKTHRERCRILKTMAEQSFISSEPINVSSYSNEAIQALIDSGTLLDMGNDKVTFRHDVFREWAIANILFDEANTIEKLVFKNSASTSLVRGVELAARFMLERSKDDKLWYSFLINLSRNEAHGSWRRAALLALVKSEISIELLTLTSDRLFADNAILLQELIRTVMAVDVEPAMKRFNIPELQITLVSSDLNVPSGPSWIRLIRWLLSLKNIPSNILPDVVDFYGMWPTGTFGIDSITPLILKQFYLWLTEIEMSREGDWRDRKEVFGGQLTSQQIRSLESNLRTIFLLFGDKAPELAIEYLKSLQSQKNSDNTIKDILKSRGTLVRAAPKEMTEITIAGLIPKKQQVNDNRRDDKAFGFTDHIFLPVSPNQGPFLEFLIYAPEHGLALIRKLVNHAVSFRSRGGEPGDNAITIYLPDKNLTFPWTQTYMWSREKGAIDYCVTSSLMALEAWAHKRIESGEDFDKVLSDVLGDDNAPAAYLLVAVDLILSHWPKSQNAAISFLSNPALLSLDIQRHAQDQFEYPDFFGLKELQKEPTGLSSVESLKNRPSRKSIFKDLIGEYTIDGPAELLAKLKENLQKEIKKYGMPSKDSTLRDPEFMVIHALNLCDINNWKEVTVKLKDGSTTSGHQYNPPESEIQHLQPLQAGQKEKLEDISVHNAITIILKDPSRSTPEFAKTVLSWAQNRAARPKSDTDEDSINEEAILTAATIAARDGNIELRKEHEIWLRTMFEKALQTKDDAVYWLRSGLQFNPIAIAFVGISSLLKHCPSKTDISTILNAAVHSPGAAHALAVTASIIEETDERLIKSILRCALNGCIQPNRHAYDETAEKAAERLRLSKKRMQACIEAELSWLESKKPEPDWPKFPEEVVPIRKKLRIPGGKAPEEPKKLFTRPDEYTQHQGAALWLSSIKSLYDVNKRPWLRKLVQAYGSWTANANGAELEDDDISDKPDKWNNAYFELITYCLPNLDLLQIDDLLTNLTILPDEPFFDILPTFLRSLDHIHLDNQGISDDTAAYVRSKLGHRLMNSDGWKRLSWDKKSDSIEMHIGPAIAVMFFNDYSSFTPAKCYLNPKGTEQLDIFIPILQELVISAPCTFVSMVTLNLMEVLPKPSYLSFIISATKTWMASYSDDSNFWVSYGIGKRVCKLIGTIIDKDTSIITADNKKEINELLAQLVRLGVPEAHSLELTLAKV